MTCWIVLCVFIHDRQFISVNLVITGNFLAQLMACSSYSLECVKPGRSMNKSKQQKAQVKTDTILSIRGCKSHILNVLNAIVVGTPQKNS